MPEPRQQNKLHDNDLVGVDRHDILDVLIISVTVVLTGGALVSIAASWPWQITFINVALLAVLGFWVAYRSMVMRPDHVRAQQSDRILTIATEALAYMREGLDPQTASAVCGIVLRNTVAAAAVAITDRTEVLGFAGTGSDHHLPGGPIVTRATRHTIEHNKSLVLRSKPEIGCPKTACPLVAAIVVPLRSRDHAIGTLKFYYTDDHYLNETELSMAEGLASLLSMQLEVHELEEQASLATEMELKALQAQINPHFLFNTLNTISVFIRTDPVAARDLLKQFAKFYRYTLENADSRITLELELSFLEQYFALEKARFGERLNLTLEVDEDLLNLPMPSFMLQPLVENSVGHGMRDTGDVLEVLVSAKVLGSKAYICVEDNGVGMSKARLSSVFDSHEGTGLGIALGNVRDRLSGVFGSESEFIIESEEGVGTKAWFIVPLHELK